MIKLVDLRKSNAQYLSEVREVLASGEYISGRRVAAFEDDLGYYTDSRYAVAVGSGTDAIVIALESLGVESGDEVITSPYTFIATAEAIRRVGATPVYVDIDRETYNLDAKQVASAVTGHTAAILAVNLFGVPCDLSSLRSICDRSGLYLVLDSAQAIGSQYGGDHLNKYADATAISFYPSKLLGGIGDSGAILTDSKSIADHSSAIRTHGSIDGNSYELRGYNSRMDEIQGAVLSSKLRNIEEEIEIRYNQAWIYSNNLPDSISTPGESEGQRIARSVYTIETEDRDSLQRYLYLRGVESRIYYERPVNEHRAYLDGRSCANAREVSSKVLSLPIGSHLGLREIDLVCAAVRDWTRTQ